MVAAPIREKPMTDIHAIFGTIGFNLWQTGGNCTAFGINLDADKYGQDGAYILVTDGEDAIAPDDTTTAFSVGLYDDKGNDGSKTAFNLSLTDAIRKIGELAGEELDPYAIIAAEPVNAAKHMDDLDDACLHIQKAFGITDGGYAAMCLSGIQDEWQGMPSDERAVELNAWIRSELHAMNTAE